MSNVFYVRPMDPPAAPDDVYAMAEQAGGCFDLHRVDWVQSYLAAGGGRMLCWYRAPDAESARMALRQLGSDMNAVWAGAACGDEADAPLGDACCVVIEFRFDERSGQQLVNAREAVAAALASRDLTLVRWFASSNGTNLVCVARADDEGIVGEALQAAGLTPDNVWSGAPLTPAPTQ